MEEQDTTPPLANSTPELLPPPNKSDHKTLKVFLIMLLVVIAGLGLAYSAYAWVQTNTLQSNASTKDAQIKTLTNEIGSLKGAASAASARPVVVTMSSNTINFREIGLSMTVPDSIKDLTYSYSSGGGVESVNFSTKAITDKYSNTGSCTSFGSAPPLGGISKFSGQYTTARTTVMLLKQYPSYYISYSAPQSACVDTQDSVALQLQAVKSSLATIKEL